MFLPNSGDYIQILEGTKLFLSGYFPEEINSTCVDPSIFTIFIPVRI